MKINIPVEFSHRKTTGDQCHLALIKRQKQEISTGKNVYKRLSSNGTCWFRGKQDFIYILVKSVG